MLEDLHGGDGGAKQRGDNILPNRRCKQVGSEINSGQRLFRSLPDRGLLRTILLEILSAQVHLVND